MGTRKLIICRGIQGSGKSTWAKQWCHEDPKHRAYGSQGWKGWGGETYFKKYGEVWIDVVDKKKTRRESKEYIKKELYD